MTRKHKSKIHSSFIVGIFVLIGGILFTISIIWLGVSKFTKESKHYVTYFSASIGGLEKGSAVKYLGVPVGTVNKVRVAPDGKLVEVEMQIESKINIDSNLRVKAEMSGITGGKYLQLSYPTNKEMLVLHPKISFKPPFEIIKSSPSGIDEMEIAMREVMNNLRLLNVSKISNKTIDFLGSATNFFDNKELYEIVTKLKQASGRIDNLLLKADSSRFIPNIENTSEKLLATSEQFVAFGNRLNSEIDKLDLSGKVNHAFALYDSTITNTRKAITAISYKTEDVLSTLNETLIELQITNKKLRKALNNITENPSQMLFSEPPPKEK